MPWSQVIGRIEVLLPGGDEVVGHFMREGKPDGSGEAWFGFYQEVV